MVYGSRTFPTILPFNINEEKASAAIRSKLESKGELIGSLDIPIAGIAVTNQRTLVSHKLSEFNSVNGLNTEDW